MRNILKQGSRLVIFGGLFCSLLLGGCELDYQNTNGMNPDNIWKDKKMILAYLNDIHGGQMPGWPIGSNNNDEAMPKAGNMSNWARGINGVETSGQKIGSYEYIDKINFLLDKLENMPVSVLSETENKQIKGQALFWRAWEYFGKINAIGGVPLILKPQDVTDMESLYVPRNKTSECINQILKDLDEAIASLPDTWKGDDYGRIDKCAAMSFKGRVLLWWASPLFNPSNDQKRWEDAYTANKAAVEFLKGAGKELYPDYTKIWKDERNKEVVMLNQFYYPDHATAQHSFRPEPLTQDDANYDQPVLQLLLAFPQKDGSPLTLDTERLKNDESYNAEFLDRFYNNRDDRFYTSIFCGGTKYPSRDDVSGGVLSGGQNYWCNWKKTDDGSYMTLIFDQLSKPVGDGISGFHRVKGIDETLDKTTARNGNTDWIEIRFAEVLMNYGECANEVGKSDEALDVLYQIRKRAGIEAGTNGHYGLNALSQEEIREAYLDERHVEFAFEGMRGGDLRRLRQWSKLNEMKHRHGLYIVINDEKYLQGFDWTSSIRDKEVRKMFHAEYIENLDGSDQYTFNYDLNHYFYPLHKEDMERNSKLEQNKEWGGTFDPLQ